MKRPTGTTAQDRAARPALRAVADGERWAVHESTDEPERTPSVAIDRAPVRVSVVSDDAMACRGIKAALEAQPGMAVVSECLADADVSALVAKYQADVLLVHGPCGGRVAATVAAARRARDNLRVVLVGPREAGHLRADAIEGVHAVLPLSAGPEELAAAVRVVAAGYVLTGGPSGCHIAYGAAEDQHNEYGRHDSLTKREQEVLALVAHGMSNAEIALALILSEHTVKSHIRRILGKLDLRDRVHLVIYAYQANMVVGGHRSM